MDPLLPRKPQDVDRWSDESERDAPADPATGPADRWVNETARTDPDLGAPTPDREPGFDGEDDRTMDEPPDSSVDRSA